MKDAEKIIKECEWAIEKIEDNGFTTMNSKGFFRDVIKLLKGRTAEIELEGGGTTWWHVCGECQGAVDSSDQYCRHCGSKLIQRKEYSKDD